MNKKHYNRKNIILIHSVCSIILLITGVILFIETSKRNEWNIAGAGLTIFSIGLMELMMHVIDKEHDITIDYNKKEIIFNLTLNEKKKLIAPFNNIVNVYKYNKYQLKEEIKIKKYPKETLVIEKQYQKIYISIDKFSKKDMKALIEEILKVREKNENNI